MMLLRPDGHPNNYGHSKDKNVTIKWLRSLVLARPVDICNEFLLYMLKIENQASSGSKLQRVL